MPISSLDHFPKVLTQFYSEEATTLSSYDDLVHYCGILPLTITEEQVKHVEEATRDQAKSEEWFHFKAGRISSSTMKACCRTNPSKPSISLIKRICYPSDYKFTTSATTWGCQHEADAIEAYEKIMSGKHKNFKIAQCGFIISQEFPFIGASPDRTVSCDCCGFGCAEVKCPFCIKNKDIKSGLNLKNFCLVPEENTYSLSRDHAYFYQVQSQINICAKSKYGDFILWTEKDIFVERILPDHEFWQETVTKAQNFFYKCLLPVLVAKYFTSNV